MRLQERFTQKPSRFSQKSEPYINRSNPSLPLPSLSGAGACMVLISRASRISGRSQSTPAIRSAWISPMQSALWPTESRRTRRALRSVHVILTHKGDRNRQQEYVDRTIRKARERIGDYRKRLMILSSKLNILPAPQRSPTVGDCYKTHG
jgi:hypothetical protein